MLEPPYGVHRGKYQSDSLSRKGVSSMNGFADGGGFDGDDNFGEAKGVLRTFDAFRMFL